MPFIVSITRNTQIHCV